MASPLDITVTAPFSVGDVVAHVALAGGASVTIVLRDGRFQGNVEGTPVRLQLTQEPAPDGEAEVMPATLDMPGSPQGPLVTLDDAYGEHGIDIPPDGRVAVQLTWAGSCHKADPDAEGGMPRFGSWEHQICAARVGLDTQGKALVSEGVEAWFNAETKLTVGASKHTFGQIVALGGDFYAHLDDQAARDFAWAWPELTGLTKWVAGDYRAMTLAADTQKNTDAILAVVARDKDKGGIGNEIGEIVKDGMFGDYPARRYLALASANYCHFGSQPADGTIRDARNEALRLYRAYHRRALVEAVQATNQEGFERALVTEAFGCHFLTDLFASGHIRVMRRVLAERGDLVMSAMNSGKMHNEDNELGLWCRRRVNPPGMARVVWRAYGDGAFGKPESAVHRLQVQDAVRRSVAELFAVYSGVVTRHVTAEQALAAIPAADRAEALIPVPLPAGAAPTSNDVLPNGFAAPQTQPNPWPLFWLLADGRLAERLGVSDENLYTVRVNGKVNEQFEIHAPA